MITSLVGKVFLKAYNQKFQKQYSAKDFFEKEYFECFFNHPKYMQWVTNSPFVQGITTGDDGQYGVVINEVKISDIDKYTDLINQANATYGSDRISKKTEKAKGKIKILLRNDNIQRNDRLVKFEENIFSGAKDGSIALGYPASEEDGYGTYSGLVSDIEIKTTTEDVYFSWIGSGLGIGVAGGFSILITDENILLETYIGWNYYRKYLNDPTLKKLKGNQINSWNGQWLAYKLGNDYRYDFDFSELTRQKLFEINNNILGVDTINWSNLFFSLSRLYPEKTLNAYVYSLGDKNKTIGFIPIYLKSGKNLKDVFKKLFHSEKVFETKEFQSLFGMHIKRACELGNIGLHALRPENLKKYMKEDNNISFKKEEDTNNYKSFKTWLVAMLSKNNEEITDYTLELASSILKYKDSGKGNARITLVEKELLNSKTKKGFIESLTILISDIEGDDLFTFKKLKDEIHLMTNEEFGYFCTLLKFDYTFVKKQS